jgi:SAM-dependent MidA family methyltransferase
MVTAITNANARGNSRLFKRVEAFLQILPEAVPLVRGVLIQVDYGHAERKHMDRDVGLALGYRGPSHPVDLPDDWVGHRKAAD